MKGGLSHCNRKVKIQAGIAYLSLLNDVWTKQVGVLGSQLVHQHFAFLRGRIVTGVAMSARKLTIARLSRGSYLNVGNVLYVDLFDILGIVCEVSVLHHKRWWAISQSES